MYDVRFAEDKICVLLGRRGGLSLTLNIEQYDYMNSFAMSAGVHVLTSDHQDDHTLVYNGAQSASAGSHTSLAVRRYRVRARQFL